MPCRQWSNNVPYRSVNPATGEVLKTFTECTDVQVMNALAAATKRFAVGPHGLSGSVQRLSVVPQE
jgi:acyl-CoA reductase-like NAD-dependent aldehyde dehydrogenase